MTLRGGHSSLKRIQSQGSRKDPSFVNYTKIGKVHGVPVCGTTRLSYIGTSLMKHMTTVTVVLYRVQTNEVFSDSPDIPTLWCPVDAFYLSAFYLLFFNLFRVLRGNHRQTVTLI